MGIATAKAFALSTGKPLVGVHHIQGHLSANYIANPNLEPPFTALIVSGGHTELISVRGYDSFKYIGGT
ncbi:MAG TPA: tRNA (adenosine(37)-N6)-threonylcarbamoyltransferase complex transferase subunit TsaD, partial [Bacillota bacterium]|nr:tRNA (adenosine(37)-N6)-threonylcarbamoyltransferase complex transferase subunit TsaD [Bacillota bacterium]